jgi:hypothetical protein
MASRPAYATVPDAAAIADELRTQVLERPLWTLGIGAAAGYALGGGIGPRLVASLLMTAGRAMLWSAVSSTFAGPRRVDPDLRHAPRAHAMDDRL